MRHVISRTHRPAAASAAPCRDRDRRRYARRDAGDIDVADLCVGLGLAIGIPVLATIVLAMSGLPLSGSAELVAPAPVRIEAPPLTPQELDELRVLAARLFDESAGFYLRHWRTETNATTRIFQAKWARACLERCRTQYETIVKSIENAPAGTYSDGSAVLAEAQGRLAEIAAAGAELEQGKVLDLR